MKTLEMVHIKKKRKSLKNKLKKNTEKTNREQRKLWRSSQEIKRETKMSSFHFRKREQTVQRSRNKLHLSVLWEL